MAGALTPVQDEKVIGAICDANVLIDYAKADMTLLVELVGFWGRVYVPDIVLREVRQLPRERAEALGLIILETPLSLPEARSLSFQDRACLHFVIENGWTCIANDRRLRDECANRGRTTVWGLEMLLKLVSAGKIPSARARDAATHIRSDNPLITEVILADFLRQLDDLYRR
jgi:rRNA-processing protein FCF1